jgi:hypothetical protein
MAARAKVLLVAAVAAGVLLLQTMATELTFDMPPHQVCEGKGKGKGKGKEK